VPHFPWRSLERGTVRAGVDARVRAAPYAPSIDVEITPEPSERERAAIEAALAEARDSERGPQISAWSRAALEDGVGPDDRDGSAPAL